MTGRSTVILEEGKITGSFIKVYCKKRNAIKNCGPTYLSKNTIEIPELGQGIHLVYPQEQLQRPWPQKQQPRLWNQAQ